MRILIADSGSTKTSWMLVEVNHDVPTVQRAYTTMGLNPLFTKPKQISGTLTEVLSAFGIDTVDALYFYGAGCRDQRCSLVQKSLASVLPSSAVVKVASDIEGACRAMGDGICCIMGTGSVAAFFQADTDTLGYCPSLGYILGDEGSGAYFGRQVLSDYLKYEMPLKVRKVFEEDFGEISLQEAIAHVYQGQFPNRYLASFAPFIGRHLSLSYCHKVALQGVRAFFKRNVMHLHPKPTDRISFVGSVAFHLQDVIREVASCYRLQVGTFLQNPIDGLVEYHKINH